MDVEVSFMAVECPVCVHLLYSASIVGFSRRHVDTDGLAVK